ARCTRQVRTPGLLRREGSGHRRLRREGAEWLSSGHGISAAHPHPREQKAEGEAGLVGRQDQSQDQDQGQGEAALVGKAGEGGADERVDARRWLDAGSSGRAGPDDRVWTTGIELDVATGSGCGASADRSVLPRRGCWRLSRRLLALSARGER